MGIVSFPSLGMIVASALVDVSQQKPSDFKDKSQSLKSRKALPPAHQGTCVWATAPPSTGSFSLPSERHVKLKAFQRHGQNTIWLLRLKSSPIHAYSPKIGWRGMLLRSILCLRQVTSHQLRLWSSCYHGGPTWAPELPVCLHPNPWRQRKRVPSPWVRSSPDSTGSAVFEDAFLYYACQQVVFYGAKSAFFYGSFTLRTF